MARASFLKSCQLCYFSQPKHHRAVYRAVRKRSPATIVELGIGDARRSVNLIRLAQRCLPDVAIAYTGIDLFEARDPASPGLSLKSAHQQLKATGAKLRLVPGDPFAAMSRTANCLVGTDLLVIGHDQDQESLQQAWFYVPRILVPDSLIFVERCEAALQGKRPRFFYERISVLQAQQLAQRNLRRAA